MIGFVGRTEKLVGGIALRDDWPMAAATSRTASCTSGVAAPTVAVAALTVTTIAIEAPLA